MVRQPKKLTDCPENLRESIDWLIQVKHGNGNGKGLDELAKALKKLIGEAIQSATDSLINRETELKCGDKYSTEHHNKHCEKLQKEIEKEKESKDEDKISKAKSNYNNHYNEVHYLTEDARGKALGDIEERQKTLKDLQGKLEGFIGKEKDNPATEILKNLTDGLEKFLGFNPSSKGYDGSGIVYSDLDRLCDGVMAFLHGVLSGVKDDDAVNLLIFSMPFYTCFFSPILIS
ncbi:hypothetical protein, conserved [Babesia ovata]|uniref:Uncharacterized protein n=1 Tax=Babesia ovata TaxID=189622 RepID=A0A2H6KGE4_9APIC|nr:uncharacterized protein BOVATA_035440 [Babesia ovata]GBE62051.1 hypothetical protein, conserved [Babesia ovata]